MLPLGSATHAAKRAADVLFVLQNKAQLDPQALSDQLNKVLEGYGEQSKVAAADLVDLKAASDKLYAVFTAQDVGVIAALLNAILSEYAAIPRLSAHNTSAWHLHVDSNDHAPWAEWFAASSALALALLLADKQRSPGGICAATTCERPFIDLGKGGGRNYCSPRCATRERVAAHRRKVMASS